MSHEITQHDNVLLHRERAWHNLGIVIPEAVRPTEALPIIGADWGVVQVPVYASDGKVRRVIPNTLANYRGDLWARQDVEDLEPLGIVSGNYKVFSNVEVADFCEALQDVSADGKSPVRVETAGTIQGGKKVWFLLKGESFGIGVNGDDEIFPYVLVSNGHDGRTSLSVTPTTIRVVCSNTLHMVIPRDEAVRTCSQAAISIGHVGDLQSKVTEARRALEQFDYATRQTRDVFEHLAKREISVQKMAEFFAECYTRDLENKKEAKRESIEMRRKEKRSSAWESFARRFDDEKNLAGTTWWNALNAYTGLVQHDAKAYGKTDADRIERRAKQNLMGLNVDRAHAALQLALHMAS